MGYNLSFTEVNTLFEELKKDYKIYAPKRFEKQGRYSDTDIIRYDEVSSIEEIEFKEKSDYPAKEVITPISQTLYYFTEDEFRESSIGHNKKILIFARPCDINAQRRQDIIYLKNGNFEDTFYKRIRERVKFICIECVDGFDTCFCTSMNSNKTEDYALAVRVNEDSLLFNVKDTEFDNYFTGKNTEEFELQFIESNKTQVTIPEIKDKETLIKLKEHPMWQEFNKRCIECGSCTIACSTCCCYTSRDVVYDPAGKMGERKRVQASCHIDGFDEMAGGHKFRITKADKMRYKVLHKIHDYKEQFGVEHMCVGCGRCTDRCPEHISITATINKVNKAVNEIMEGM
ncbi:anaerobic sulfite reductase subunit AsrA [Clostridium chauvoei]|uniref:Anaerobic sulfite reductase subunit AsrA n=2 Tax=Clostridium chauvoei TaxID=46867 RepID=A0ABD4RJW5_9CLOT|nr:anaerobic sulfite reductase subunit AsrA [Clostridium chauvoei]ATD56093.1 anaerobic sulfite reductase subunit A [Clostridium chauvoei]ATD58583.1 anaerobic sulfite reductase subunit A [Clostridium chauvoei]MBX7281404.1 anaerobic sulfite reductase subunit AsrA [Clostridium chauvoei]MBX7283888.1 anaerobic sulfite reductase subunit AsrA [Clostridium chauvoei]MBX7286493.1 anaerobic sulfite reductase subunit AsrA [Clostridium chauvoei]